MAANTQADVARLSAISSTYANNYLNIYLSFSVGARLDDSSLRIAITLRQGAQICEPHICICGDPFDSSGTHGLSCRMSAGHFSRHAAVNDLIKRSQTSARVLSRLKSSSLNQSDGKRPDDY